MVAGAKLAGLSTSAMPKTPPVVSTAPFSVRVAVPALITAASLVPWMLMLMAAVVPSVLVTVKLSL